MPNEQDPFAAFKAQEPPADAKPERKKREKKAKPEKAEKKEKRPRKTKTVTPSAGNGVMVPISALAAIRHLTDDEIKFTVAMAGGIAELSKASQQHVVVALARIFS